MFLSTFSLYLFIYFYNHQEVLVMSDSTNYTALRYSPRTFYLFICLFIYLFIIIICFTILYWFCHTSTWICHGCTHVPNPEPPSHHPPHTISLGHPSAPAPSILYPASNLDWWFISYMILYMFLCHSPKSTYLLPLSQSPKDCSIHLCLLLSSIQGYHYHLSKFHIYELVYCIGVFLSGLLHSV